MKSVSFFVSGRPTTKQKLGRDHRKLARVSAWEENVGWTAKIAAGPGYDFIAGSMLIWLDFYLPDERIKDVDNLPKPVFDGMEGVLYENDKTAIMSVSTRQIDRKNPGVHVHVYEVSSWRDAIETAAGIAQQHLDQT